MLIVLGVIYSTDPSRLIAAIAFWVCLSLGIVYYGTSCALKMHRKRRAAAEDRQRANQNREAISRARSQRETRTPTSSSSSIERTSSSSDSFPSVRRSSSRPQSPPPPEPSVASSFGLRAIRYKKAPKTVDSQCSICLGLFKPSDRCHYLTCSHIFHQDCLVQWLESSYRQRQHIGESVAGEINSVEDGQCTCPVCRQSISGKNRTRTGGRSPRSSHSNGESRTSWNEESLSPDTGISGSSSNDSSRRRRTSIDFLPSSFATSIAETATAPPAVSARERILQRAFRARQRHANGELGDVEDGTEL